MHRYLLRLVSAIRFLPVLLAGVMISCSTLTLTTKAPEDWQQILQQRNQIVSWKIQGKLGIQTEDNGGSLDLFWNQKGDAYQIRMIAPMGQGAVFIRGNGKQVYVKTAEGEEQYSDDVDTFLITSLGVNIPLTGLRNWLRGMPMSGAPVEKQRWDKNGRLVRLVQNNWNIEMSEYRKVARHMLPHSFYIGRDDRPELDIRLLIRSWKLIEA